MRRRTNSLCRATVVQLVLSAVFVCVSIYVWKVTGCWGFSQCILCQKYTPGFFQNNHQTNSSSDDFFRLMNLNNFTFLINNFVCNNSDLLLLVLVHSHPHNEENRSTIRKTWGQIVGDNFKVLFLLGMPNSPVVQKRLDRENKANGDLIQGNFLDTYRNLTYKHVMGLKWTKYFCSGAQYLLKTDDDVFINSPAFLFYVKRHVPKSNLMRCWPVYDGRVKRSSRSKWRVKFSEYKFRSYPAYCQGLGILYSPDVVSTLYAKAQKANYFWIDDVFITGILGSECKIFPSSFGSFVLEPDEFYKLLEKDSKDYPYLLGPWNLENEKIKLLWEMVPKHGLVK